VRRDGTRIERTPANANIAIVPDVVHVGRSGHSESGKIQLEGPLSIAQVHDEDERAPVRKPLDERVGDLAARGAQIRDATEGRQQTMQKLPARVREVCEVVGEEQ
jgi:hypothetical protein